MPNNNAIVILAAGSSRRLGRPKQLVEIDGETLIHRIARKAAASQASEVLVVLGHLAETIEPELIGLDKVHTIHNPDWQKGMGTSIRAGVKNVADCDAMLISVCDQPYLTTEIFDQLIARLPTSPAGVVCSRYLVLGSTADGPLCTVRCPLSTAHGVPAIFASKHFPALLALPDDAGAKGLLTGNDVDSIEFSNGAIDIDTPHDLENISQQGSCDRH